MYGDTCRGYRDGILYRCVECDKQFRVTTGTIMQNSNLPLRKWFLAIHLITVSKKGISSVQLAKHLGITQKSAWNLAHKIRECLGNGTFNKQLKGTIEVDETYIGGKHRFGKRGRGSQNKTPVFGMLERDGTLKIMPVENTKRVTLEPIILESVKKGSKIMSDEWGAYNHLHKHYIHKVVNHGIKEYARGEVHVNSLEGFWSILKRGLKGIYHRPSKKYLSNYCGEFEFRYNNRKKCLELQFNAALSQTQKNRR